MISVGHRPFSGSNKVTPHPIPTDGSLDDSKNLLIEHEAVVAIETNKNQYKKQKTIL